MKKIKIGILLLAVLFIARQFYTLSDSYIKQHAWLGGSADGSLPDGFSFGKECDIINDTLFCSKTPFAVIVKRGYRPIIANYMVVKSLKTNEIATYHEK